MTADPARPSDPAGGVRGGRFGLRARAFLFLVLVFSVVLARFGYLAYVEWNEDTENTKARLLYTAERIAAEQSRIIAYADQYLDGMMHFPQVREIAAKMREQKGAPDAACSRFLAEKLDAVPSLMLGGVAALNGDALCSAAQPKFHINIADRPYFQAALKRAGDPVISDVLVSRGNNRSTIVIAKALREGTGGPPGVVWVALDLGWLSSELARAKLPPGAGVGLFDAHGTVLARHPDTEGWLGKDASGSAPFKQLLASGGRGAVEATGLAGDQRLYAFTTFADTVGGRIFLWTSVPKEVITTHVRDHLAWSSAMTAALLLLLFAALWLGGERMLLRPVSALSEAAGRIARGDLSARSGLDHAGTEFGSLARSFDQMAQSIKAKETQLVKVNRALRVLSEGNRALLRAADETALLHDICRAVAESGGYRWVWVGYAQDDEEKSVLPVASFGLREGFFEELRVSWGDNDFGRGPTGAAIRGGAPVLVRDTATDPRFAAWRERSLARRFRSVLALPLTLDGQVRGALVISADETDAFSDEEVDLLLEAAGDLSFGIDAHRARARRAQLEALLTTAEERFRAAAEANLDALFILKTVRDDSGNVLDFELTDVNLAAEKMLGRARDDVLGRGLRGELAPVFGAGEWFEHYAQVANTRAPLEKEFFLETAAAGGKWLRQQVVPVGAGIAVSSRDITAWKTAGDRLRESESRYRQLFETNPHPMWVYDRDDLRFLMVNDAAVKHYGYGREEFLAMTLADIRPPEDVPRMRERVARVETGKVHEAGVWRHRKKDGTVIEVEIISHTLVFEGRRANMVLAHDVTAQRRAEAALKRSNRALKTLSAANEKLVHATAEAELLQDVCRVIVDKGGYQAAGVCYARGDAIEPVRSAGSDACCVAETLESAGDSPALRSIRSGRPELVREIASRVPSPWRDRALQNGCACVLSLPLSDGAGAFGALCVYAREPNAFDEEEIRLLAELGEDLAFGIRTLRLKAERDRIAQAQERHQETLRKSLEDSVQAIADTVDMRDPYTAGHQRRVAKLAAAIAVEMALPEDQVHGLRLAASIHDMGKIKVPAEILAKPGRLSDIETLLIKTHAQAGYEILKDIAFPWPIAAIVWEHHERLDGSGYPRGLKGEEILLESRIMAVADVVEAMSSHRPYRPSLGIEAGLSEIERGRGSRYDPAVVDACLRLFRDKRFSPFR